MKDPFTSFSAFILTSLHKISTTMYVQDTYVTAFLYLSAGSNLQQTL
jgi:hypothetical protein